MGKIRTRVLGMEDEEQKQKDDQKKKSEEKKAEKKKSKAVEAIIEAEKREKDENAVEEPKTAPEAKVEKKAKKVEEAPVKRHVVGKKHKIALKHVEKDKVYSIDEAVTVLKKIKYAKFEESVEVHLNVESTGLKGEANLPHSIGKTIRVAIVDDALLEDLEKGNINFDILVSHPSYMAKLSKFARTLGPKGLMPNPKAGTVSPNPEEVAKKFSTGVLRWKTEPKFPLVHQLIGKVTADNKALTENVEEFIKAVGKPNIQAAFIKTTMSPALKIDIEKI